MPETSQFRRWAGLFGPLSGPSPSDVYRPSCLYLGQGHSKMRSAGTPKLKLKAVTSQSQAPCALLQRGECAARLEVSRQKYMTTLDQASAQQSGLALLEKFIMWIP